jgi:hypothetical protein
MTPEVPNVNVSDPQGAIDSVVAPEPQIAPPAFKSRFADIIKRYEEMLAKSQAEDQQASSMLNDLMRPDSFRDKYLPKPTARGILADALYNFGMSYQSSRTGQQFRPIEQQRLEQAMDQYRLDVQNKRVDVENRRNTMQNMLGQMQQLRLAQSNEEQQFQAQERQRLAEETEKRRRESMEANNEYKQALLHLVNLPKTASELELNAARKERELALAKMMQKARNPLEMAQLFQQDPFYKDPGIQQEFLSDYKKLMENSRAGMMGGMGANYLRPIGNFIDPNTGQFVRALESRDGSQTVMKPLGGLQPLKSFSENQQLDQNADLARAGMVAIGNAIGTGYINEMSGLSKNVGIGPFSFENARRTRIYGEYDPLMETQIDQTVERLRSFTLLETTGKAVNETELRGVMQWAPNKTLDSGKDFGLKVLKLSMWAQLVNMKKRYYTGQMTDTQRSVGFVNKIDKYANEIYTKLERMGKSATPEQREALMNTYTDMIFNEAINSGSRGVTPPSATPLPAPKPKVEKPVEATTPLPKPGVRPLRYNPATGRPE